MISCALFADELHKMEAAFAMDVVAKSVPYLFGDTANILLPLMFADSQLAKITCGRKTLLYVVSDCVAPYFIAKVKE